MGRADPLRLIPGLLAFMLFVASCGSSSGPAAGTFPHGEIRPLPSVVDVSRSAVAPAADRVLLISEEALMTVSPEGEVVGRLELPAAPCGLAVRGLRAAVSHSGFLTLIDLETLTIERILEVNAPCAELVLGEDYAYLLPPEWGQRPVIQVSLFGRHQRSQATAAVFFDSDCDLVLHPSGRRIYVACNKSVGRIGLDVDGQVDESESFESRAHRPPGCSGMWLSNDGEWAYAACGDRFRSRDALPPRRGKEGIDVSDLSPAGELPIYGLSSLCEVDGILAVAPAQFSPYRVHDGFGLKAPRLLDEEGGRTIEFFTHPQLRRLKGTPLAQFPGGGGPARGRAVFCGLRSGEVQVLVREDDSERWGWTSVALPELP